MPDLVTHCCVSLLPRAFLRGPHTGAFVVGAALPDLAARLPVVVVLGLDRFLGIRLPELVLEPFQVLHMPLGAALGCVALAGLYVPAQRRGAVAWLLGGAAHHLVLDVMQDHAGFGYQLLFPFVRGQWELGWIGSEATVPWVPALAGLTGLAWIGRIWWDRRRRLRGG